MKENIYQHFREEEQEFVDSAFDWVMQVEQQFAPYLTPFLNPREQFILSSIAGQYEQITLHFNGGFEQAERKRAFLAPDYFQPEEKDFEIVLAEIDYPTKFSTLSHGQIMGSILGAGIKREMLGDIITDGERWQFFVDDKIFSYLLTQVDKIGRTKVSLHLAEKNQFIQTEEKWDVRTEIVSSLRLDVVLAGVFNLSRGKAKELIASGRVKMNWTVFERPDIECEAHDVLSIRGFGRVQIREVQGTTKKNKLVLEVGILDRNK